MRGLFSLLFLMFFATGLAQDSIPSTTNEQAQQSAQLTSDSQGDAASYTLGSEEYRFIPDALGFRIAKIENGEEIDYGHLRLTTDDGYYVMTSMINDHVSYGRFDEAGNFNAMRYYEESDKVVEEHFVIAYTD